MYILTGNDYSYYICVVMYAPIVSVLDLGKN